MHDDAPAVCKFQQDLPSHVVETGGPFQFSTFVNEIFSLQAL